MSGVKNNRSVTSKNMFSNVTAGFTVKRLKHRKQKIILTFLKIVKTYSNWSNNRGGYKLYPLLICSKMENILPTPMPIY